MYFLLCGYGNWNGSYRNLDVTNRSAVIDYHHNQSFIKIQRLAGELRPFVFLLCGYGIWNGSYRNLDITNRSAVIDYVHNPSFVKKQRLGGELRPFSEERYSLTHLLTYLLTYSLTHLLTYRSDHSDQRAARAGIIYLIKCVPHNRLTN